MKLILEDKIASVTATPENANYPATFLLNESPKRVYKSTTNEASIVLSCGAPLDSIAIFNTNAIAATVIITDPNAILWNNVVWYTDDSALLGAEICTEGDFHTADNWNTAGGWSVDTVNQRAVYSGSATENISYYPSLPAAGWYEVVLEVSGITPGDTFYPIINKQYLSTTITADGTYTYHFYGSSTVNNNLTGLRSYKTNTGGCYLDSVSIKPCTEQVEWYQEATQADSSTAAQASNNSFWFDTTAISSGVEITIHLTAPDSPLHVGVIVAGEAVTFPDPRYGLAEGLEDYSIYNKMANGSLQRKDRDRVRTFAPEILPARNDEFYSFMHDFAREYGLAPKAWKLTALDSDKWIVYARLVEMPKGNHSYPTLSPLAYNLIEVI